jgi:hypothetical protein
MKVVYYVKVGGGLGHAWTALDHSVLPKCRYTQTLVIYNHSHVKYYQALVKYNQSLAKYN